MEFINANGASIPALGFGTFRIPDPDTGRLVAHVLKSGYRHVDTAQIYGNEAGVGEGITQSGVNRRDIFLTTKVWVENYAHRDFIASVDDSLSKLQTNYVDLLLLHWPSQKVALAEQIGALNEVAKAGKARHIGVSNFNVALMKEAVHLSDAPLVTNQVEYHPYLDQSAVIGAARALGMSVTSYYAMADGKIVAEPDLQQIAAERRRSVPQVVLRWVVQQGLVALSKTISQMRAVENAAIFDFELSPAEMQMIHALARPTGRLVSPEGLAPTWDPAA